jgi:hypothetical protein
MYFLNAATEFKKPMYSKPARLVCNINYINIRPESRRKADAAAAEFLMTVWGIMRQKLALAKRKK